MMEVAYVALYSSVGWRHPPADGVKDPGHGPGFHDGSSGQWDDSDDQWVLDL